MPSRLTRFVLLAGLALPLAGCLSFNTERPAQPAPLVVQPSSPPSGSIVVQPSAP